MLFYIKIICIDDIASMKSSVIITILYNRFEFVTPAVFNYYVRNDKSIKNGIKYKLLLFVFV